jgi:hypothetical protein
MDKDTAWSIFETTGNIEMYMLYYDLTGEDDPIQIQEDYSDANQNRRPGDPGLKRR